MDQAFDGVFGDGRGGEHFGGRRLGCLTVRLRNSSRRHMHFPAAFLEPLQDRQVEGAEVDVNSGNEEDLMHKNFGDLNF